MTSVENEMIDSFVRGELEKKEAQGFQQGYLTSQGRQSNVEFAKALAGHLSSPAKTAPVPSEPLAGKVPPAFFKVRPARAAFAAIGITSLMVIAWLAVANFRLHRDLDQLRTQQAESQH